MKFGDTLAQRSVPQWRNYNIDYATLKTHIRGLASSQASVGSFLSSGTIDATIKPDRRARPLSIPVDAPQLFPDVNPAKFEDELYSILKDEHDRVGLFVRSKSYEINSRLGSIERQLNSLHRKSSRSLSSTKPKSTLKLRQRFSKIESDILRLGDEIQNLSRFISMNRLAVSKLLKKYQKWTGLTSLAEKVEGNLLPEKESFTQIDLSPALSSYTTFLNTVREPFSQVHGRKAFERGPQDASLRMKPDKNWESLAPKQSPTSDLDFDLTLSRTSTDPDQQKAVYWVHKDNIVELRILLLQYMRYVSWSDENSDHTGLRHSTQDRRNDEARNCGAIVLSRTNRTSRPNSSQNYETAEGLSSNRTTVARWVLDASRTVAIQAVWPESDEDQRPPSKVKLKRGDLLTVIRQSWFPNREEHSSASEDEHSTQLGEDENEPSSLIRKYLCSGPEWEPVTCTLYQRSRFGGLEKDSSDILLASLDEQLQLVKLCETKSKDVPALGNCERNERFPHAVLTVKAGTAGQSLLSVLNQSHLVNAVPNFSFEGHAFGICRNTAQTDCPWLPKLNTDIRYLPPVSSTYPSPPSGPRISNATASSMERRASTTSDTLQTPNLTSMSGTSASGPVTPDGATVLSPISTKNVSFAPEKNAIGTKTGDMLPKQEQRALNQNKPTRQQQSYWNEYDDPESDFGNRYDEDRFIYIDPDAPLFLGQTTLSQWGRSVINLFTARNYDPGHDLESGREAQAPRKRYADLLGVLKPRPSTLSSSSEESGSANNRNLAHNLASRNIDAPTRSTPLLANRASSDAGLGIHTSLGQYATFNAQSRHEPRRQDLFSMKTSTLCLVASAATLAVMSVLLQASRTSFQARVQVDVAILVGVAAALAFVLISIRRSDDGLHANSQLDPTTSRFQLMTRKVVRGTASIILCVWSGVIVALTVGI